MFLRFVQFKNQVEKQWKNHKKTISNQQRKNMKHHWEIHRIWSQKASQIHSKINTVLKTPSKTTFLSARGCFRESKCRRIKFFGSFLAPPWILRGPQTRPKSAKWRQNDYNFCSAKWASNQLASQVPFGTLLGTIFFDFGWILDEFWWIWASIW